MRVRSLGWEDLLDEEMATHSSILAWGIPWTEELVGYSPQVHKESNTTEASEHAHARHLYRACLCLGQTLHTL